MTTRRRKREPGWQNTRRLRKLFRRLPEESQKKVSARMSAYGDRLTVDAKMNARAMDIIDSGDMINSIAYKVRDKGSTLVVGPGAEGTAWQKSPWDNVSRRAMRMSIKQKRLKMQFFKAYWAEFGTKYRPEGRPFMGITWDSNESWIIRDIRGLMDKVIKKASGGS